MRYIYCVTNRINGLKYIGQTNNMKRRWYSLCCNNNNQTITKAIQKYGKENFKMECIEKCHEDIVDEREKYWINYYNTYEGKGYNEHVGGRTLGKGKEHPRTGQGTSESAKKKMSKKMKQYVGEKHYRYGKNLSEKHRKSLIKSLHKKSKFSKKEAIKIIKKYHENELTLNDLSEEYNCHRATIRRILNLNHWTTKDLEKPNIAS